MIADPRRDPRLVAALELIAPGTDLRLGIDDIINAHHGALIVIADREEMEPICSGGILLDAPFSPQMLYELAKMDGAIVVDRELTRILRANVQLMPDASLPTSETGTRHRTAERVSRQTGAVVVAISQERDTVNLYTGGARYQLESIGDLLAKATQGLQTLQNHRTQLDRGADELTLHELRGDVALPDVLVVLQRAELATRMIEEIRRNLVELGLDGRLVGMQLGELSEGVADERMALVRDYRNADTTALVDEVLERIAALRHADLLALAPLAHALGYAAADAAPEGPRGYRALARISGLGPDQTEALVAAFPSFDAMVRSTLRELSSVPGVTPERAAEVHLGLRRLHDRILRPGG